LAYLSLSLSLSGWLRVNGGINRETPGAPAPKALFCACMRAAPIKEKDKQQ